jgi:hypothetical protein
VENRWLLILPALALSLGCESKASVTPSAEPESSGAQAAAPEEDQVATSAPALGVPPSALEGVADTSVVASAAPSLGQPSGTPSDSAAEKTSAALDGRGSEETPRADSPAKPPSARRGGAAKGEGFNTWLEGVSSYPLNQPATLTLVLQAEEPFKCNEQYPYRFTITPSPGISVAEPVLRGMNIDKQRSTMSVPFTPTQAGTHTLSGELSFSVCTDDKCLIEKQSLSFPIDVSGS